MMNRRIAFTGALGAFALAAITAVAVPGPAHAQNPKGTTLRVAVVADMTNFDPMQFSLVNFHLIKNLYDSLIEYTADGKAVPSLATEWSIAEGNKSVRVTLRKGVSFHSGAPLTSADVAATLKKASDPAKGKNVYATMGIVQDWTTPDEQTIVI